MSNKSIKTNRSKAFAAQLQRCFYCDSPIWQSNRDDFARKHNLTHKQANNLRCTAEHLLAKSEGGSNASINIVAACQFCNSTRHKMTNPLEPNSYKEHVRKRMHKGKWHRTFPIGFGE